VSGLDVIGLAGGGSERFVSHAFLTVARMYDSLAFSHDGWAIGSNDE